MAKGAVTVPEYVDKLELALRKHLPGAKVKTEPIRRDRYRFIVVWNRFDRMGHPERQRKVWDIVDSALEPADLLKVGMIITLGAKDLVRD